MTVFRGNRPLLDAFRRGDPQALETVYWQYVETVGHVVAYGAQWANARAPGAPLDAQEDVVQETFLRAFAERTRLSYDGLSEYRPFLLAICRNVLADWWRRHGRDRAKLEPWPEEDLPAETPDPGVNPTELAWTREYLAALPAELKLVHEQRYVMGKSQQDAAATLGISRQNLRTLEARLRKGLQQYLHRRARQQTQ